MEKAKVVVVETVKDMVAEFILATLLGVDDLDIYEKKILKQSDIANFTRRKKNSLPWVLVLIGLRSATENIAQYWLEKNPEVVVLCVDVRSDHVNVAVRNPTIDPLLSAIRQLLFHAKADNGSRKARLTFPLTAVDFAAPAEVGDLLSAAMIWSRQVLKASAQRLVISGAGKQATAVMTAAIADLTVEEDVKKHRSGDSKNPISRHKDFETAIARAESSNEALAVLRQALSLSVTEFKLFCLVLCSEIDAGLGRWLSLLQDDLTRKSANLATFAELLGEPASVASKIFSTGNLSRWHLIQSTPSSGIVSDDTIHIDPEIKLWLLNTEKSTALTDSLKSFVAPHVETLAKLDTELHVLKTIFAIHDSAASISSGKCYLISSSDTGLIQALVAHRAKEDDVNPCFLKLHSDKSMPFAVNSTDMQKLTRRFLLTGEVPIFIWPDSSEAISSAQIETAVLLLKTFSDAGLNSLSICHQNLYQTVLMQRQFDDIARVAAQDEIHLLAALIKNKLKDRGHSLDEDQCLNFVRNYNATYCDICSALLKYDNEKTINLQSDNFDIKTIAVNLQGAKSQSSFSLAQWITPSFVLDDVILPPEQKQLLYSIADTVKFRGKVLDEWKFREKTPYGLGVVALFHGPSGTGKTMAAMALAHEIGIGLLRIDMSQLVSKYIGETEKNIDQVFRESTRTGAAIMCDEVEALMSRRSDGNSAVERSFNMEVAYLLQRLEAHEGLVILTTNARNSIDSAFMRRIGHDIPFSKPDAAARAKIITRCLPAGHHTLKESQILHLAKILNVPGGSLWQIVLRAAYAAAAVKSDINIEHLEAACRAELARLGVPISQVDMHELRRAA